MNDQTIPADKVQEIIEAMKDSTDTPAFDSREEAEQYKTRYWQKKLESLLPAPPAPRTLADELRAFEARGHWDSAQLDSLADRVETLEQERDEGNRAVDEVRDWSYTVGMENKRLAEELAEARVSVEEHAAEITRLTDRIEKERTESAASIIRMQNVQNEKSIEIARLEGLEVPGGWRVASHAHFGPVIAVSDLDSGKHHCVFRSNVGPGFSQTLADPTLLSFWDEAPAPQPEGDYITGGLADSKPEHIDPANCGRYRPYWINAVGRHGCRAIRMGAFNEWRNIDTWGIYNESEVTVLRPLTSEEMDAR